MLFDPKIHHLDAQQAPCPWRDQQFQEASSNRKGLKIGILEDIPFLPSCVSIKRGIRIAKQAAERLGYEVVNIKFEESEWWELWNVYLFIIANGPSKGVLIEMRDQAEPSAHFIKEMKTF